MDNKKQALTDVKLIAESVDRLAGQRLAAYGMSFSQLRALEYMYESGEEPVSQKQLEEHLAVSHPTVVGILRVMEKHGLVRCAFDSADRRRKNVYLTDAAWSAEPEITEAGRELGEQCFGELTEAELGELAALLARVKRGLTGREGK